MISGFAFISNFYLTYTVALNTQNINLTGVWRANDGGTYYIRNLGDDVWWLGISTDDAGKTFSNVLRGQILENNNTIVGDWTDLPMGSNMYYGTLTLNIDSNNTLNKINESSYSSNGSSSCCFGATKWQR